MSKKNELDDLDLDEFDMPETEPKKESKSSSVEFSAKDLNADTTAESSEAKPASEPKASSAVASGPFIKEVQIRRRQTDSHVPDIVKSHARYRMGSHWVGQGPLRALDFHEERKYLPSILGISPEDPAWGKATTEYWANFSIEVPAMGTRMLNISTSESGEPYNVEDWIQWRFACAHKHCAKSRNEFDSDSGYMYYIHDDEIATKHEANVAKIRTTAYREYIKLSGETNQDERIKLRSIISVGLSRDMSRVDEDNFFIESEQFVMNNPAKFLELMKDKDIVLRAKVAEMIGHGVLGKQGNIITFGQDVIGATVEEAVAWMKLPQNAQSVGIMDAKLFDARKKS